MRTPIEVAFAYTLDEHGFIETITMSGLDEDGHVTNAIREREQHGHEEWAKDATFRYTRVAE